MMCHGTWDKSLVAALQRVFQKSEFIYYNEDNYPCSMRIFENVMMLNFVFVYFPLCFTYVCDDKLITQKAIDMNTLKNERKPLSSILTIIKLSL